MVLGPWFLVHTGTKDKAPSTKDAREARYRPAASRVSANSSTPSSARVLPIASKPDSVMAAVSTNVSMNRCVCKTLAHSTREPLSHNELEQTLTREVLRPSGGLPILSRGSKRRAVATHSHDVI